MTVRPDSDVGRMVAGVLEEHADRVFLVDSIAHREVTYSEFAELSWRAAGLMHAYGARCGSRVGLVLPNSLEFAAAYFGCLFLGATAVPVSPAAPADEVEACLARARVDCILHAAAARSPLTDSELFHRVPNWPLSGSGALDAHDPPGALRPLQGATDDGLFSITFTSGTTSTPKGVAHKASALLKNATAFNAAMGFGPDNRFLHVLPMCYMAGFLNTLLSPFMAGSSVVLARPFDARSAMRFWDPVIEHRADTFWLSPTILSTLLKIDRHPTAREYAASSVRTICVGTAPLPMSTKSEFERVYGVELFESYGLSELLLISGASRSAPRLPGSAGRLLPGVVVRVTGEGGESLAGGIDGEISVKTPYAMAGYLDAEGNADAGSVPDWFSTGDLGHVTSDGDIFITGRKKDLIIRGGINVSPRAVEDVLLEHEAVERAAVVGVPDDLYGELVVAVVTLRQGRTLAAEHGSLHALCRHRLSVAAVPERFVAVDRFPENFTGKILKRELRDAIVARRL